MNCPNLFIVGMPKCGTTALGSYLQKHPDVLMSVPKEPHYFDAYYEDMSLDEYCHKCFGNYKGQKILGEATPVYLRIPWALERLAKHFPKAKFIALLRNPISRAYSHWWMFFSRAMEPLNFKAAIKACIEQKDFTPMTKENWKEFVVSLEKGETLQYRPYLANGYYAKYISNFFEYFNPEQLLVIRSEEFNHDIFSVMKRVYDFLELSSYEDKNIKKINEAYGSGSRHIFKIAKSIGVTRFTQLIPESTRHQIKKVLAKIGDTQPALDQEMRAWLFKHYEPYNQELERMLHQEFGWE